MSLIQAEHLTKRFAAHTALNDVSITIPNGKITGLLGPNGAGKSTFIRIISKIIAPDEGTILFDGSPLSAMHIERMGYMPEERGLYKKMEIGEQVLYLARLKGMTRNDAVQQIRFWFKRLEMENWVKKKVADLSKGMQQKIQFIATVIHRPEFIILDEPFSGFDPVNAAIVKDEIMRLNQEGATIMLSTHRMESVEELCTNIVLINKSQVVIQGPVREIRQQHRTHTYHVVFNGDLPPEPGFAQLLENSAHEDGRRATFRLQDQATPNELLRWLLPNVSIIQFEEFIPTMNDIFISAVGNSVVPHYENSIEA